MSAAYPWTAHWEDDPARVRIVKRACKRCAFYLGFAPQNGIVSASGVEHATDGDTTICGKDATGDAWWWPS